MTFAEKVINFIQNLHFDASLPAGIEIMNPFSDNPLALEASKSFYTKYYSDQSSRHLILGINPGRLGAGNTGIPFTDPKRLEQVCQIPFEGKITHEPSSVFVYEVIDAYGDPESFYQNYYISSVCPLGFLIVDNKGKVKNYNYYNSKDLSEAVKGFCVKTIEQQLDFGIKRNACFCFGNNKNFKYLSQLNAEHNWFEKVIPLAHPRYIMQYKNKSKQTFIEHYLEVFHLY